MSASALKAAAKQVALNLFPDLTLKLLSIRSRRLSERVVRDLGHDTLARHISRQNDGRVASGPFRGMRMDCDALSAYSVVPKLLGTYEQELHRAVERAIECGPSSILNIGCADGFYAVGMAMRLPHATIYVADPDPKAIRATMRNAKLNGVAKQVVPIGIIHPGEFDRYLTPSDSLLIVDCEGAEFSLLNPKNDSVLSSVDMIVEVHPEAGSSERLWRQFEKTHQCERLYYTGRQGIADELTHQYQRLYHLGSQGIADEMRDYQEWLVLNVCRRLDSAVRNQKTA